MPFCKIEKGSHYFKITEPSAAFVRVINDFARKITTKKLVKHGRRFIHVNDKIFAARTADLSEYRFHIHQYEDFKNFALFAGYDLKNIPTTVKAPYEAKTVDIALSPLWKPRPDQIPVIEYGVAPGHCKTFVLQTGKGKTSCSLKVAELCKERTLVVVLGKFYEKWFTDLGYQYQLLDEQFATAKSGKEFKELLRRASTKEFESVDVILTTIDILLLYIQEYCATKFKGQPKWVCPPEDIYAALKVGTRIIDEVHMHFHKVYTIDLFTNIHKALNLSATLKASDALITSMYEVAFPMNTRINSGAYTKIAKCKELHYKLKEPNRIRYEGFAKSYSHIVFEESMMNRKKVWENYLKLIQSVVDVEYARVAKPGQKMLIFAAKIEACISIKEHLVSAFPDLVIEKYTGEDDYETFSRADVIVSTLGSSGTAIDIPGLITVLMTIAINSIISNEQALGRLRDLKIPGLIPLFIYLCCDDIRKHKDYANRKRELFQDKVFGIESVYYGEKL